MATTISTQDIIDAKRDIDDIGKAVNEKVIVSPRYGDDFKSLPMIADEAQAMIGEWQDAINTIVVNDGIPALAVSDASGENQQGINNSLIRTYNSVSDLLSIPNPQHGQVAFVRHYDLGQGILDGGGIFVYQNTNQLINDGGYIFNGWTRKLEQPIFTPEMFGAKGDLSKDDAPSIRAATTSAYTNNIKSILFSKKYLIDTPENVGDESLIRIYPRCSYIGIGGAELVVGDNIPDKFHILAAAFFESLQPDSRSVLIDGIKFRALSTATNMDSYATNMAIHTFGLSDVCIQNCIFDDLDTANVIVTGVKWQGVNYGARVLIQNNRFLSVVAENLNNTDHSTVYLNTPDSFALNNLFKAKTMQTAKNCCAIEVHAPNITVSNNQILGYGRGVWLAAFEQNVTNANILNNVAHVSNHLVIVSNSATQGVFDCRISGNRVRCSHAQVSPVAGEVAFNGWQGILVADGQLDPNGWMLSGLIEVEKNTVHFDHSIDPKFSTMVYVDQQLSVSCLDNVAYNALGGAVFYYGNDTAFSGNKFYNRVSTSSHKRDLFIEYITNYVSNLTIDNNKFYFTTTNSPVYLIGLPYVTDYDISSIYENKVFAPAKITGDLFCQNTLNISKYGNTVDFNFYNISVNFPAMTAGQEYVITAQLPNNVNNCIAEAILLPDSRFYPLTTKGIVSGGTLTLRVKATATTEAFSVGGVTVRVRTT